VNGQRDEQGAPLVPAHGTLDADTIARAIGTRLLAREEIPSVRARLEQLDRIVARKPTELGALRTPFFCSGCPHNTSTVAPDGEIVGAGIGCHTMVMVSRKGHGEVHGITQMGGEGAQWIGTAPFVGVEHFTQNLGDGTFHHSGSLAVRAAVAAGLNVTYKLLFNGAVAMTGGQQVEGGMSVPAIATALAAEGVERIVITAEDTSRYEGLDLPGIAEVRDRGELLRIQRELAAVDGVTVLIHDQACAAELRRARKRGRAPEPPQRVVINERVCEGCGDCGEKSGCLSVEPVDTEFGRKTRINQTTCNKDYSCLEGDCPSFLTVIPARDDKVPAAPDELLVPPSDLPEPEPNTSPDVRVRLVGIGGTGVVTVSQVIGMAALLDGRHAAGLDQTGLSQKAGPVVSDVRITERPVDEGVTVPSGAADVILGFDLLGTAGSANLRVADPARTVAIVSGSVVPTGGMVVDVEASAPDVVAAKQAVDAVTSAKRNVYLDAQQLAECLLGDATPANVIVLGAAWQRGVLPVSLGALQEAIRLNGVAVERNLAAISWGRAWVAAPELVLAALGEKPSGTQLSARAAALLAGVAEDSLELRHLLEVRVTDLLGWGGAGAARRYLDAVERVRAAESQRVPGSTAVTQAFARGLHKLTAYKDEYEVARLHREGLADLPAGAKVRFHLHPPLLRALGMKRKLRLGRWFVPCFRLLRHGRLLRGTPFDPFGYAAVRRIERQLPGEYTALVAEAMQRLGPQTLPLILEAAGVPELVRGYEEIKLAGVERFRRRAEELRRELELATGGERG
jgi:indolepyruvate ferredoxin oxidoreductase